MSGEKNRASRDRESGTSSPPSPQLERFVWEALAPRLIGQVKRSIIETLLRVGEPLAPAKLRELGELESCSLELVRYHAKYLARRVGVLEVVGEAPRPDGEGIEPTYFFPSPPKRSSSSAPPAAG